MSMEQIEKLRSATDEELKFFLEKSSELMAYAIDMRSRYNTQKQVLQSKVDRISELLDPNNTISQLRQQQRLSNIWNIYVHELNIRRSDTIKRFFDLHIKSAKQNREFGRLGTAYLMDYRRTKKLLSDPNYILRRTEVESANTRLTCLLDKTDKLLYNLTKRKNCQR